MKPSIRVFLLLGILAMLPQHAFAWTFGGNIFFLPSASARAFSSGLSSDTETFTDMGVDVVLREEGSIVDQKAKFCTRAGAGSSILCGVIATDPTLSDGCNYCGVGAAAVTSPGTPSGQGWGTACIVWSGGVDPGIE